MKRSKNFSEWELKCHCNYDCGYVADEKLIYKLELVRAEAGFAMPLTSTARCPRHNREVSSTGDSGPHVLRLAADISVYGERAHTLVRLLIKHGFTGIGLMQKGPVEDRYIHADLVSGVKGMPRPWIWTY